MITILEYPHLKLYWYDDDRTILVGDIERGWTWDNAHAGLRTLNETVKVWAESRKVYVILHFHEGAQSPPKGESSIANMRQVLTDDPNYETLTIIVAQSNVVGSLIKIASRMYQVTHNHSKYRYVSTFDHALKIITDHKTTKRQTS